MSVAETIRQFPFLFALFAFWFGACVGSFLNVCVYRIPLGLSIVSPPSHCPACKARIRPWENVPIFSWLLLRGRCAHCGAPISPRYILVETATGLLWAALFLQVLFEGRPLSTLALLLPLVSLAIPCFLIDCKWRILPNEFTYCIMALGPLFWLAHDLPPFERAGAFRWEDSLCLRSILSVAGALLFFWAFAALGRRAFGRDALGMGDVKLLAGIAGCLGPFAMLSILFLGSLTAVACVSLFRAFRPRRRGRAFAFGPFLILALIFWMFAGGCLLRLLARVLPGSPA